jgi:putative ABC transport system substrate-binding protein
MRSRRRLLALFAAGIASPFFPVLAQPKVARIGILSARSRSTPSNPEPFWGSFARGMRELGYVEGKNLVSEWRYADGKRERFAGLAAELVRLNPDVIVTHPTPLEAVKHVAGTMPIVVTSFISDPVADGYAKSLARPGGNVTGLSLLSEEISLKQVELLTIMLPTLSRLAVLMDPGLPYHSVALKNIQAAAQPKGIQVLPVRAANLSEIESGFDKMAAEGIEAVLILASSLSALLRRQIADSALKRRILSIGGSREQVVVGTPMAYGTDIADSYRRAAGHVDRILKGAKPGDLTKFHLAINRRAAKALGITVPMELLRRADEVIE